MNHRCACTWVRTRRAVALAALTWLAVGCGATGSAVDTTTVAPTTTTTTTATTTATGASTTSTAPASTSVSLSGGLRRRLQAHRRAATQRARSDAPL